MKVLYGKVTKVDYEKGTVDVMLREFDDMVITGVKLLSMEYDPPNVGESTYIVMTDDVNAIMIGSSFGESNRPKHPGKNIFYKEMGGCSVLCKDGKMKISGIVEINGAIEVTGTLIVNGKEIE